MKTKWGLYCFYYYYIEISLVIVLFVVGNISMLACNSYVCKCYYASMPLTELQHTHKV